MRRMPITDAFFLLAESRRTPMHVGGLNLFTPVSYTHLTLPTNREV